MYLFIPNFRKKLLYFSSFFISVILIIIALLILVETTIKFTITLNSNLSFSYSQDIRITNIYSANDSFSPFIQVSNVDYKKFLNYKSIKDGIEFSYPSVFELNKKTFPESEINYHIDFRNKEDKMKYGFIQVWTLPYSLEKFLDNSLKTSLMDITNFSSKKIDINNVNGYLWEYTIIDHSKKNEAENIKALEAFLSKDSNLYRISYFLPLKDYDKNEYEMFWNIVKSLKIE